MNNNINTFEIKEKYNNLSISVNTSNIDIKASNSNTTNICVENYHRHTPVIKVDNNTLIINQGRRKWFTYLYPNFKIPHITINIPQTKLDNLNIKCNTGYINISNVASNGNITIKQNTGKINILNIKPNTLTINSKTGCKTLENVIVKQKLHIKTNSGKVILDNCDAKEIFIKSNTGNISGIPLTDKAFIIKCKTGKINIPETFGGNKCEIVSNTGNINLAIKKN